ncbi:MAG: SAF domain-containing protein [Baekduia sp.]
MTPGRRAVLLGGCALLLGGLSAADVSRERAEIHRAVGDPVPVVVATAAIRAGDELTVRRLGIRQVPRRYAPQHRYEDPAALDGLAAATDVPAGADLQQSSVDDGRGRGAALRQGERVFPIAGLGDARLVVPGARVDVLVTWEGAAGARLVLAGAEVLSSKALPGETDGAQLRVEASLRVGARQLRVLADAADRARAVRLIARPAG